MTTKKRAKRYRPVVICKDEHLTKQDHGGEANINTVANRYLSGKLPYPSELNPVYADLTAVNIQESRDILAAAESGFYECPSDVRDYFGNDPAEYFGFLEENKEQIVADGLSNVLWDVVHPGTRVDTKRVERASEALSEAPESADQGESPLPEESNEGMAQ